jgi:Tfp pilus assembly protein PilO
MNVRIDREFVAQMLIALVAIVGAWMMFVQPKAQALRQLEQTIRANSQPRTEPATSVAQLAADAADVRARIADIDSHNSAAMNSSDLYARIGNLAQQHGVIVHNVRPGAPTDDNKEGSVKSIKIDLSIEGPYANAAEFLDAISSMSGFIRPVSMTVSPVDREGQQLIVVRHVCELLQFSMPEALTVFRGANDGV